MMFRSLFVVIASVLCINAFAGQEKKPDFYYERERGWFWHESDIEAPDETEIDDMSVNGVLSESESSEANTVLLDLKWLQENIEILQNKAIEYPTTENVAAYAYAQRLMLDMSSRFSTAMMEFMTMESLLDESVRRPTSRLSLNVFERETAQALSETIRSFSESSHIWFFYSSDCPYCIQQLPVLRAFANRYDLNILAISLDGGILPGAEHLDTVFDTQQQMFSRFNIQYTPALVLAKPASSATNSEFTILSEGLITLDRLERVSLLAARDMNIITQEQYALTTDVRDISTLRNEDGLIEADRNLLENDTGYLAELLRERLRDITQPIGAAPVNN